MPQFTFEKCDRGPIGSAAALLRAIDELHHGLEADRRAEQKVWFRGHGKSSYSLIPSIGREHIYGGKPRTLRPDDEWMLLHRFRRRCYALLDRAVSPVEAMFLGRQHGLPTRLLDWTASRLLKKSLAFADEA